MHLVISFFAQVDFLMTEKYLVPKNPILLEPLQSLAAIA
jgi:hypothetical protein